jgi:hypothetical protein
MADKGGLWGDRPDKRGVGGTLTFLPFRFTCTWSKIVDDCRGRGTTDLLTKHPSL